MISLADYQQLRVAVAFFVEKNHVAALGCSRIPHHRFRF
jgi:hypothetical protein